MSDLDPIEIFRQEADELMQQLEGALLDLDRAPHDQALIDSAFRALHTLKGSGAMFGFDRMARFIHEFESAFDRVRKGRSPSSPALIAVALDAKDHIRQLIDTSDSAQIGDGEGVLDRLRKITNEPASTPVLTAIESKVQEPALKTWSVEMAFDNAMMVNGGNPLLIFDEIAALGPGSLSADCLSVPSLRTLDPQNLYMTWSARVTTAAPV